MPIIRVTKQSGSVPTISQLEIGDIAINTYDGKAFFKKRVDNTQSIVELATTGSNTFYGNQTITGSVNISGSFCVGDQCWPTQPLAYASFYSTEDQPIEAPDTPQSVRLNAVFTNLKVNLSGSGGIVFDHAGIYQFTYVAQVQNNSNSIQDAIFWIKYNDNNFPHSATLINLQAQKSAGNPSSQLMTFTLVGQAQNDNDKIELWWQATSTDVSLNFEPVSTYPEKPSVIANIIPVR